jgi:hypothetical protein
MLKSPIKSKGFSRHTHLVILQWLLPSTLISSGVIVSCYFWWVIYFSSLQSLSSESRDEILFSGEGCDSSCVCKLDIYFVSMKYVFVCIKLVYVMWNFWKFKSANKKGIFVITEKPRVVFVKCIWIKARVVLQICFSYFTFCKNIYLFKRLHWKCVCEVCKNFG